MITKVKLLGAPSLVRTDTDVRDVFEYPKSVKVTWKDSFLTIEFEILGNNNPEKNQYAYRILGRDEEWIPIGNKNFVTLDNLKPGKYVFGVKGANSKGIWDNQGTVLNIQVIPAWYKTSLFRMSFIAIILSVLFVLYRLGRRRYRARLQDEIDMSRLASEFLLTQREAEIAELVLKGKSIKDISRSLHISESTVQKHIYNVYNKLKVRNRLQLIHFSKRFRLK